ncbi:MAG: heme lyase CcmF/NrfE family subunit [Candidatus Marinimicrobia bacterium]|jgi:cytochrome c-type biogenesis protein CcmF|nr:heme lyase CcmF/NrfE family subunit [Candidatus Neomarinimicrobiota bacterium]MBT7922458.1 heme lyase CcmF/NrfE family subunit [Candidatus Neomarinimicrobiota bacterium]MBT7972624.1 heme lyase CcmF/NrfE family subunit [Candidatus Neomarinimicrobiota bacterium]MCP4931135.1 heme lyase CcmF/NrfE family subunit [Candidatus Neomarinimicrobiota bacterium]MDP6200732.1 heme lyase CcmF/NrfE family subunit [Candidatus Neomarinimicrobiota bacterium]
MTPIAGSVALNLAFGFSILTVLTLFLYNKNGDERLFLTGQRLALGISFFVFLATFILAYQLVQSNFDIDYVARYTSLETPVVYKISALWAGQSGSLLFWLFILSIYTTIVILQNQQKHNSLMPWVIITLAIVQMFFLVLTNYVTNPFKPTDADFIVSNGNGLNPLLQNVTMAIHPPTLYLGYVGFSVPFGFAISAMINRDTSPLWIQSIRRWSLVAWLFLSIGIILGGWWAYRELGWGGYWAWDPVENASFMPWLTATAFVHSIIIQEKKDMLRVWNMVLIIITFTLCIFGTFLTRSGVMSSVHSFTGSSLGPIFLTFVFSIMIVSFGMMYFRRNDLRSTKKMESFTSRESGFLFNNMIFVVMCFAVFWGTLFPVFSEAIRGTKITVGPPFFNQINIPIGLILLALTGIGPLLAWRKTGKKILIRNFTFPIITGLIVAILLLIIGLRGAVVISFSLGAFVTATITTEFTRGIQARRKKFNESIITALIKMVSKNRSRYGGYVVHLGIVFMFVGFTGHAFDQEKEFSLKVGESNHVAGYNFKLIQMSETERPNHYAWISDLRVTNDEGKFVTNLHPEKRIYFHRNPDPNRRQPHSELDIYTTMNRDIYSIFSGVDSENSVAFIKIMVNPLVQWVWLGGYILVFGTIVALWPRKDQ